MKQAGLEGSPEFKEKIRELQKAEADASDKKTDK